MSGLWWYADDTVSGWVCHRDTVPPVCVYKLHYNISSDEDEATEVLLDSGGDVNARSRRGLTPLNISAAKGNISVLKILLKHPKIDLHVQVCPTQYL